jgi:hypothetical protein
MAAAGGSDAFDLTFKAKGAKGPSSLGGGGMYGMPENVTAPLFGAASLPGIEEVQGEGSNEAEQAEYPSPSRAARRRNSRERGGTDDMSPKRHAAAATTTTLSVDIDDDGPWRTDAEVKPPYSYATMITQVGHYCDCPLRFEWDETWGVWERLFCTEELPTAPSLFDLGPFCPPFLL